MKHLVVQHCGGVVWQRGKNITNGAKIPNFPPVMFIHSSILWRLIPLLGQVRCARAVHKRPPCIMPPLYHAQHVSVSLFQPWMLIILTQQQQLMLLSISNLLGAVLWAVLCLPRLCLPQGLEPTAKPPAKPAPKAAKPRAKPSTKSAAKRQILPPEKVAHGACFCAELNMHPNRQFLAHFVVLVSCRASFA